jgi:hypothetical protein
LITGALSKTLDDVLCAGLDPVPMELPAHPQPGPQTALIECGADEVFYGGAKYGGKSFGMLLDYMHHQQRWRSGARGILFRRQFADLDDIIDVSRTLYPFIGGAWRKDTWHFDTGGFLKFRYLKNDADAAKYQGHSYTWVGVEEAGTYASFDPIKKLKASLRSPVGVKVRFLLNANPGGPGHNWLKARYIDPAPPNEPITEVDPGTGLEWTRIFIPAKYSDNPAGMAEDPGYIFRVKQSGDEWLVRAWLDGDWNIVAGGMFDDLFIPGRYERIVVPPFKVPPDWLISRSFDWGSTAPFSVGWWAESDGRPVTTTPTNGDRPKEIVFPARSKIRLAEWYGANPDRENHPNKGIEMLAEDIARGILEREHSMFPDRSVVPGAADSAIYATVGTKGSRSIADEMADAGVAWVPSAKGAGSRVHGWQILRRLLTAAAEGRDSPGLFIVEPTNRDFLRTLPTLPRNQANLEDVDSAAEDHGPDEARYFCTIPVHGYTTGHWRI